MNIKKHSIMLVLAVVFSLMAAGCSDAREQKVQAESQQQSEETFMDNETETSTQTGEVSTENLKSSPELLYMGQASIRIITPEEKVIYIDPYAGNEDDYEPSADLILVTHSHFLLYVLSMCLSIPVYTTVMFL